MDPVMILTLVNGLLSLAFNIWKSARQILGKDKIPEWSEILQKNIDTQAKIDAEK